MTDDEKSAMDAFEAWWKSTKHYDKRYYEKRSWDDGSGWFYAWDSTNKAWRSWSACWAMKQEAKEPAKINKSEMRDHFAGMAVQAMLRNKAMSGPYTDFAQRAYKVADAMLNARSAS